MPVLSDADFARIAAFAHREYGLNLQPGKKDLVQSRLTRRLARTGCADFGTWCDRLERGATEADRAELVSALTTNVTHFFREEHHFRYLSDLILTPRADALRAGQRLRLWSAGCSAGQEAWSMAATLMAHLPETPQLDIRILATDLDPEILARARSGEYPEDEAVSVPEQMRRAMFVPGIGPQGQRRIAPRLQAMVRFAELNLMGDWPFRGPFDAIFCRNVAIYFDKPTQARLWQRLAALLAPGGLLCIGHSERLSGLALPMVQSAGITAYRRPSSPASTAAAPPERTPA
jgi:chemotaxis protein methyltransferase CheR